MNIIEAIEKDYMRDDIPELKVGDTVKVYIKIKEGNRERVQLFEGYVLKIQNGGLGQTFTVRRIASGVGVEKTFPVNSPMLDRVEVVRHGFVRRAKLNYMRARTGKAARVRAAKKATN
ncbi:MAG: 50S ribosomal protein L19 [Clostridia bacterium]|nr:50S ribosomal protein L19 [Clostridia bacterium]